MEVFANRGFSSIYPENTLLAVMQAVRAGVHGVLVDVRMTLDDELILMRDRAVDRTTDGTGNVDQLTLSEIQRLDAGVWKGIAYENEPVPTLEAVLQSLGDKLQIILELKPELPERTEILIDRLHEQVLQYGHPENIIVASRAYRQIMLAKSRIENIKSALMPESGLKGFVARHFLRHSIHVDAIHMSARSVNAGFVRNEHVCSRKVRAWVGNDSFDMLQMQKMEVDGIITEDPLLGMIYAA